jgi:hypothetical protein
VKSGSQSRVFQISSSSTQQKKLANAAKHNNDTDPNASAPIANQFQSQIGVEANEIDSSIPDRYNYRHKGSPDPDLVYKLTCDSINNGERIVQPRFEVTEPRLV